MPGGYKNIKPSDRTNGFEKRPQHTGRPKGSRNRSTVTRELLDQIAEMPEKMKEKFKEIFPELPDKMIIESALIYSQMAKAMKSGDTQAFKAIMDNAYGLPVQSVNQHNTFDEEQVTEIKVTHVHIESKDTQDEDRGEQ